MGVKKVLSGEMPGSSIKVVMGPTAVGKTAYALRLADELGAEIVSADSRQVYRELEIGVAKPSPEERARVRHHFIGERSIRDPLTAGTYAQEAWVRIQAILTRGNAVVVVGGSTLYLQALTEGIADIPEIDPALRAALAARLAAEGPDLLYQELQRVDPAAAGAMDPTKTQRLLRALEVYHGTGVPLSHFHARPMKPPFRFEPIVLARPRPELYARIEARVEAMIAAGLVEEVAALMAQGFDPGQNPLRTIGYQEPAAYLRGEVSHAEMVALLNRNTRRYAKRQLTWFRRYPAACWQFL